VRPVLPVASASRNRAIDKNGIRVVVYRGEHGEPGEVPFQTRQGSITFVDDPQAASHYATHPNNRRDMPRVPRVFRATLDIRKPVINQPGDPFIDGGQIAATVGEDEARAILTRHADAAQNTDNWYRISASFSDVQQFLKECPERFGELYLEAYRAFDDTNAVELFRKAGYDGAIYRGSGLTRDNVEYRVFSPRQVQAVSLQRPVGIGRRQPASYTPSRDHRCTPHFLRKLLHHSTISSAIRRNS
jgi:hypothetical protein